MAENHQAHSWIPQRTSDQRAEVSDSGEPTPFYRMAWENSNENNASQERFASPQHEGAYPLSPLEEVDLLPAPPALPSTFSYDASQRTGTTANNWNMASIDPDLIDMSGIGANEEGAESDTEAAEDLDAQDRAIPPDLRVAVARAAYLDPLYAEMQSRLGYDFEGYWRQLGDFILARISLAELNRANNFYLRTPDINHLHNRIVIALIRVATEGRCRVTQSSTNGSWSFSLE